MKFICIIPSRFASTRLPGKPLIDLGGKPMIQRVYEQACKATKTSGTVVATETRGFMTGSCPSAVKRL